ncbi:EAL domain-containing protein [Acetobacterium bakii]|uniref:EAL domain-containing protein n=1 Tax=Acetobacterium bakii TaxID=52689 RepID=UPI000E0FF13B|nr:EAL domain-containing protein [Acetobacterium bakii]
MTTRCSLQWTIRTNYFHKYPSFFFGVNDPERGNKANANPYITGLLEESALSDNIGIAYRFNPEATKVVAIVDSTLTGQGDQQQFKAAQSKYPNLIFSLLNASEYSFNEFGLILEKLDNETILLFLSMNQDKTGEYLDLEKAFLFLREHTHIPVYRASIGGVGEGLMGGKLIDYEAFGRISGELVIKILNGTPVDSIDLIQETPYYYTFDYALIQKYDIDEGLIPPSAVLVNKAENPLEKYWNVILAIGTVMVFLTIVSLILIIDNLKRRTIQNELSESNKELTSTYKELAITEDALRRQYDVMEEHDHEVSVLNQKYEIAIQSTNSAVWELDLQSKKIMISESFATIINKKINQTEDVFKLLELIIDNKYIQKLVNECTGYLAGEIPEINIQVPIKTGNQEKKWILVRGKGISDIDNHIKKIHGILMDTTKIKEQEEYINYLAQHDHLTRLPNRMKFLDRLSNELKTEKPGAVFLFDIDNFKSINDTQGHVYGDGLLKSIAGRLLNIADENMLVARLGGDEFLILIMNTLNLADIDSYAQKIEDVFEKPFSLEGTDNYINISMGITCYPCDSNNIDQLIMNADTAMYNVKNGNKNNYIYYHPEMKTAMTRKVEIESILRNALKENGFKLVYQPQVDLTTGEVIGFEALLRLKDYQIGPDRFIPIAEETGLIIEIGRWVAQETISQIVFWRKKGFKEKTVAINFSSKQLRDKSYIKYLLQLLSDNNLDSRYLEIEITESILLENDKETIAFLNELKEEGFSIALDDFGTGYSSLNYLTYMPVDKIKLDKSINDRFVNSNNIKIMESLILLAHSLNLKITAEGIEEWDKFLILKKWGCDFIQGYVFSKPLSSEAIEGIYNQDLIKKNRGSALIP